MLEKYFKLQQQGTTVRTECTAGITTFLTMVYIIFVNPQTLAVAGMNSQAVFVTTCLITALGCILMGLVANLPVALAPAMGLNAFFAFVVVGTMGLPWQLAMGTIFWGSIGLLLLTLLRVRYWMIANIPLSLRIGITSGIGLFIGMMGLKNAGIIVANANTLVAIGDLTSRSALLGGLSFFIIAILAARQFHAAVLISIAVVTVISVLMGDSHYQGLFSLPPRIDSIVGQVDIQQSLSLPLAGVIFSFMLVNLFDSSGTLLGVTDKAGLMGEDGRFPRMKQALLVDSTSSVVGGLLGTSSVSAYVESSAGVSVGGRTGLTAVVVGILFTLVIFISPLVAMVPSYATAGALIYVGVLMTASLARVSWQDLTESVPAFATAVMMPLTFSITEGIALGFIAYCVMKVGTGRIHEINPCVWVVAGFFASFLFVFWGNPLCLGRCLSIYR